MGENGEGGVRHRGFRVAVQKGGATGAPQRASVRLAGALRPLQQADGLVRKLCLRRQRRSGQGGAEGRSFASLRGSDGRGEGAPCSIGGEGR
eukprot:3454824-Pleurochrysis_carterae.AAC.4